MLGRLIRPVFERRRGLALLIGLALLGILGRGVFQTLRARLPAPLNENRRIRVVIEGEAPPEGTPLVQVKPGLQLLGFVEGIDRETPPPTGRDTVLRVSVLPEAESILRDDAEITLRVSTPDLLEIVTTWLTPERRAAVGRSALRWYRAHEEDIEEVFARVRFLADRELGADELGRKLYEDPDLRLALRGALESQVVQRVDWDRVVDHALGSEAAEVTSDLLLEAGLFSTTWAGVKDGYRSRWSHVWSSDGPPLSDDASVLERLSAYNLLLPRWEDARKASLQRAGANVREAFPEHREQLAKSAAELARELAEAERLPEKGLDAARVIAKDEALRGTLTARYGPEAWERVQRLTGAMAADEDLRFLSKAALDSGLELIAGLLRELALDDEGKGPNPLLVSFVRARLLYRAEPVLVAEPTGVGPPAPEGQLFVSRKR